MEKLFQLCSFLYLLTASLAQIVSDVKQNSRSGKLNDGQMPSQLALCIFFININLLLYIHVQ